MISPELDTFLSEKVIEWINVRAKIEGSAIYNELKDRKILLPFTTESNPYLSISNENEKKVIELVQKPTLKELFGHTELSDFLEADNFRNQIDEHYKNAEKADKGPYWYTVEEDLRRAVKEGKVIKITRDNKIVKVNEGYVEMPEGFYPEGKSEKDIVEVITKTRKILNEWNKHGAEPIWRSDTVQSWAQRICKTICAGKVQSVSDDAIYTKLLNAIQAWTNGAENMEVYVVLDSAYVSPRTKEVVHVGREGNRIWLPELFLKEVYRLSEQKSKEGMHRLMALLFTDEQQHVGKEGASHGKIKTYEGIGKKDADHILKSGYDEFPFREARAAWEKSMEGKMPWEPLLEGETVGGSPEMIKFFEDLREFAGNDMKRTALVQGVAGNGKTKVVDAVRHLMKIARDRIVRIDCRTFKHLSKDKAYEVLFGSGAEQPGAIGRALQVPRGLLVIDNFDELLFNSPQGDMVMSILRDVKRGDSIPSSGSTELDTRGLKVLCLADSTGPALSEPKRLLETKGIWKEIQSNITLPKLIDREDDILRMAEYFNFEASKLWEIEYAPIDVFAGSAIMALVAGNNAITIWDIKELIETIVANRAKTECYSDYLITYTDIHTIDEETQATLPELRELWNFENIDIIRTYYDKQKELLPYFKEFVEKDAEGNSIGFYNGPLGEQPGLPRGGSGRYWHRYTYPFIHSQPEADGVVDNDANQRKEKLNKLTQYANVVGKLISPPQSRYTLFTAHDLATDEEYDEDISDYKSRFVLERITTDKPEDIVGKVLKVIKEKKLRGEDVIVQLPAEFSKEKHDLDKLIDGAPGIKFMVIDTKGLKEEPDDENRKQYRDTIYSMMRLARYINENSDIMVAGLLNCFVDYCFDNTIEASRRDKLIDSYLEALSLNKVTYIVNVVLSYEYMSKVKLPEKALLLKTLISA